MVDWGEKPTPYSAREKSRERNKQKVQFFLACLLALLASQPFFCLVGLVDLIVSLAIGGAESMDGEIAVGFSGWFL